MQPDNDDTANALAEPGKRVDGNGDGQMENTLTSLLQVSNGSAGLVVCNVQLLHVAKECLHVSNFTSHLFAMVYFSARARVAFLLFFSPRARCCA